MATLIDGKAFASNLRKDIAQHVENLKQNHGLTPGLAVVLVGEDPASQVYVRSKGKQTLEAGMNSYEHKLPADTKEETLLTLIDTLNKDEKVHGILVQLPLPDHINEEKILTTINPDKDVDGFHVVNVGRLATNNPLALVPCTPQGCLMLLEDHFGKDGLSGKHAVVIGRSNIVGKPMTQLLLSANCTVTIAHSRTKDLPATVREADIVVAAVGRAEMVKGEWLKAGACVIDVGINRITLTNEAGESKNKLVGDVDFTSAQSMAGAITPVPGGVGPMTIACLLRNTLLAATRLNQLSDAEY